MIISRLACLVFCLVNLTGLPLVASAEAVPVAAILDDLRFTKPDQFRWGTFKNDDGQSLRYGVLEPVGAARATIIIAPGYTEFVEKYFEAARDLSAQGYAVWIIDWMGQGGSARYLPDPEKLHAIAGRNDVRDLSRFVQTIVERKGPLFIIGHSWGGNILTRYLHDHPDDVRAVVLTAPTYTFSSKLGPPWLLKITAWAASWPQLSQYYIPGRGPFVPHPDFSPKDSTTSSDPARYGLTEAWFTKDASLRIAGMTFGWINAYLANNDLIFQPDYLSAIKLPVLMGIAGQDVLADNDAQRSACEKIITCRLVEFPAAKHELLMERDEFRKPWLEAILAFLADKT